MILHHPLSRKCLHVLSLSEPYKFYRSGITERIFTNPYGGPFSEYPCPKPDQLQNLYSKALFEIHREKVNANSILFCSGSISGIDLLIRAFAEPSIDSISISIPTFPFYKHLAIANGVKVIETKLTGDNLSDLDINSIKDSNAKITFLCSPGNPAGSILLREEMLQVLENTNGIVVIDEAYAEFAPDTSMIKFLESFPNLVILRSFSKGWGLAGLRAGAVLANPAILNTLRIIQDPFSFNSAAQSALEKKCQDIESVLADIQKIIVSRENLAFQIQKVKNVAQVYSSFTNFLMVRLTNSEDFFMKLSMRSDLLISPNHNHVKNTFKVSIGSEQDNSNSIKFISNTQ